MIYYNSQQILFPEKNPLGDYNIFLGYDGPIRIEIPCTSESLITPGLNKNINVDFNPRNKTVSIRDYVEDWRDPEDPRWNIPSDLFIFLTSYKSSSLMHGQTTFQAYGRKSKTPLKCYMHWKCLHPKDRTFSIGGIWRIPAETFSVVRILYSGMANVKTKYLVSLDGSEILEYSEGHPKLLELLKELKVSTEDGWNSNWYTL